MSVLSQIVAIVIMVLLAWKYQSIWALAIGSVVSSLTATVLSHLILPSHRHRFYIEKEALKTLINFGKWIFLTTLIGYFGGNGIHAIQGLLVTPTDLGIIYIAGMIAWATNDLTKKLDGVVGLPVLSQIARKEPWRLCQALSIIRLRMIALALPVFIILSLSSGLIIDTLYDERYVAAGRYLAIMSLTGAIDILPFGFSQAFIATGNSKTPLIISIVAVICRVGGIFVGFQWAGIEGMLIGMGIGSFVLYLFVLLLAYKSGWLSPLLEGAYITVILAATIMIYFGNFMPA